MEASGVDTACDSSAHNSITIKSSEAVRGGSGAGNGPEGHLPGKRGWLP
jgi:hypothetical protein